MGAPKLNQGWIVDPWLLRHHTVGLSLAQLPPETEPYGSQPRRAMVDGGWGGRWMGVVFWPGIVGPWLGFSACIPFNISQLISRFHVDTDLTV